MALEVDGKFHEILAATSGTGKNGKNWKKQSFVIEQLGGQFVSYAQFMVWNDRINLNNFQVGEMVRVTFEINSREWQDKVYTDLTAINVQKLDSGATGPSNTNSGGNTQQTSTPTPPPPTVPTEQPKAEGADDLPF